MTFKEKALSTYYDEVAIRGLALAQLDVNRGLLDHERRLQVKYAGLEVIDNLSDYAMQKATGGEAETAGDPEELNDGSPPRLRQSVACIAGRGSLDEAAAAMLGQLLEQRGFDAPVVPSDAVSAAHILRLDLQNVGVVCLSYLESLAAPHRTLAISARRLRRKLPNVLVLVGFLDHYRGKCTGTRCARRDGRGSPVLFSFRSSGEDCKRNGRTGQQSISRARSQPRLTCPRTEF